MDEGSKRNASSTNFGFLFQINVAIYFMFSYLKEISCIRVEGKKEDIELSLINGTKYMIQAKSITKDLYDDHNNMSKLSSALVGLDESNSTAVENLFYVSNMLNPLNSSTGEFSQNYDVCIYKYQELSSESRSVIDKQIKAKKLDVFDKDKLVIMRIPFFGSFNDQLYKYIYEEVKNVLTLMSDTLGNKYKSLVEECVKNFLDNSANPDLSVVVSKKEFCNWIILTELETMDLSNDQLNIGINELDYYEAYQKYQKFISDRIDNYENYSNELGIFDYISDKSPKFVLTNKLKGLSGRILAQMSFIFKLAYIKSVEDKYNIKLPIIIDSPRTNELSEDSTNAMMTILKRDFSDNQVIVASIYDNNIINFDKIKLENGLFSSEFLR